MLQEDGVVDVKEVVHEQVGIQIQQDSDNVWGFSEIKPEKQV